MLPLIIHFSSLSFWGPSVFLSSLFPDLLKSVWPIDCTTRVCVSAMVPFNVHAVYVSSLTSFAPLPYVHTRSWAACRACNRSLLRPHWSTHYQPLKLNYAIGPFSHPRTQSTLVDQFVQPKGQWQPVHELDVDAQLMWFEICCAIPFRLVKCSYLHIIFFH